MLSRMVTTFQKLVLHSTLSVLKHHYVYNYNLPEFIRFAMNDRRVSYLKNFVNHIYLYKMSYKKFRF